MPISTTVRTAGPFAGTGSNTGPFAFTFKVFATTDISVQVDGTALDAADYSVSLNADQDVSPGGTVTLDSALTSGAELYLVSQVPATQGADFENQDGYYPSTHNLVADKLTAITQQNKRDVGRALLVPIGETPPAIASLASAVDGDILGLVGGVFTPVASNAAGAEAAALSAAEDAATAEAAAAEALGYATSLATAQRFSYGILSYGQSLAMARAPLVTGSNSAKLVMFNGGEEVDAFTTFTGNDAHWQNVGANMASLVPFAEQNLQNGEGWGQGLAYVLGQDDFCEQIAYFVPADGARDARELIYYHGGSARYANYQSGMQRQKALLGDRVKPITIWTQGEADADTTAPGGGSAEAVVSSAEYLQILKDVRDKTRFDLGPIHGKSMASHPVYVTPLNSQAYGQGTLNIQASYLDAITAGGLIILPPHYQFWANMESDGVHMGGQGRRYYAELAGQVIQRIQNGLTYQPVRVTSATIVGATIELTFSTPDASNLTIDTSTFADPALGAGSLYGLRFFDASGAAYGTISTITASGKKLVVTPSVAPAASDRIEIAQQPYPGGLAPVTNTPRSNIRCGLSHTAEDGTTLYHYALPQRITL